MAWLGLQVLQDNQVNLDLWGQKEVMVFLVPLALKASRAKREKSVLLEFLDHQGKTGFMYVFCYHFHHFASYFHSL